MIQFRKEVGKKKSRNVKFVHVKDTRVCNECGGSILKGEECLSVNKKFKGRIWVCLDCVELRVSKFRLKAVRENIPFGDEGYWWALNDFEAEMECKLV